MMNLNLTLTLLKETLFDSFRELQEILFKFGINLGNNKMM